MSFIVLFTHAIAKFHLKDLPDKITNLSIFVNKQKKSETGNQNRLVTREYLTMAS